VRRMRTGKGLRKVTMSEGGIGVNRVPMGTGGCGEVEDGRQEGGGEGWHERKQGKVKGGRGGRGKRGGERKVRVE